MVRTKIEKPEDEIPYIDEITGRLTKIEYELKTYFEYDPKVKKDFFIIEVLTHKLFSHFKYNITYKLEHKLNTIKVFLLGLSAPDISFPFTGKASSKIQFENISGNIIISIVKQDRTINTFEVYVDKINRISKLVKEIVKNKKKEKKYIEYLE